MLLSRRLPPVYGREALKLGEAEKAAFEADGRKPHWRFLLPNFDGDPFAPRRTDIHWDDLVRGAETVDLASVSDPGAGARGRQLSLHAASVVDDIELGSRMSSAATTTSPTPACRSRCFGRSAPSRRSSVTTIC